MTDTEDDQQEVRLQGLADAHLRIATRETIVGALALGFIRSVKDR